MTIGQRIKDERDNLGWTRKQLSIASGYTEQSIYMWETDSSKPSERAIRAVEQALKTKLRK